ncbi:MAG: DUF4349 domain-containing protein [Solirubrobacteraceae bacterium]
MRRFDNHPLAPGAAAALQALDATLDGEAVDPEFAALAELALILRQERPAPSAAFTATLDARIERRFTAAAAAPAAPGRNRRRRLLAPGAAVLAGLAAAIVIATSGSGPGAVKSLSPAASAGVSSTASAAATTSARSPGAFFGPTGVAKSSAPPAPSAAHGTVSSAPAAASAAAGSASGASSPAAATPVPAPPVLVPAPAPVPSGANRQIVQSAQLALMAEPKRIDDVAQQVFDVIATEKGIVNSSTVTATGNANGYASFQLSVPGANLQATMSALSELPGSRVISRTDATTDITGEVGGAGIKLAEARALRTALLKQLAAATTSEQITSLQAQLRDADASIASDLGTLNGLRNQVAYSRITLTIQAGAVSVVLPGSGSSFTLGRAAHDAGRVLVVVAGVALIALAVLIPVGLVTALAAWVGLAIRRRRREHALDLV